MHGGRGELIVPSRLLFYSPIFLNFDVANFLTFLNHSEYKKISIPISDLRAMNLASDVSNLTIFPFAAQDLFIMS